MIKIDGRTIETRIFNQLVKFTVWGLIQDCGRLELTSLSAIGQDVVGKQILISVDKMLYMPAIYDAIVSLLDEWPNGLIFNGSK